MIDLNCGVLFANVSVQRFPAIVFCTQGGTFVEIENSHSEYLNLRLNAAKGPSEGINEILLLL